MRKDTFRPPIMKFHARGHILAPNHEIPCAGTHSRAPPRVSHTGLPYGVPLWGSQMASCVGIPHVAPRWILSTQSDPEGKKTQPANSPRISPYWSLLWRLLAVKNPNQGYTLAPHGSEPQACHATLKMVPPHRICRVALENGVGHNLQHMAPFGMLTIAFCMVFQGATLIFSDPGGRIWPPGLDFGPGVQNLGLGKFGIQIRPWALGPGSIWARVHVGPSESRTCRSLRSRSNHWVRL